MQVNDLLSEYTEDNYQCHPWNVENQTVVRTNSDKVDFDDAHFCHYFAGIL